MSEQCIDHSDKIIDVKNELAKEIAIMLEKYESCNKDHDCVSALLDRIPVAFSKLINTVNEAISTAHNSCNFYTNIDLQQEYLDTIKGFINTSLELFKVGNQLGRKYKIPTISASVGSFDRLQSFIATFDRKDKEKIMKKFESAKIATDGFNHKFSRGNGNFYWVQLGISMPLLVISLIIVFLGEKLLGNKFNGIQLIAIKLILAASVSIMMTTLSEGSIKVDWKVQKGLMIRAVGCTGLFIILYMLNPSSPGNVH